MRCSVPAASSSRMLRAPVAAAKNMKKIIMPTSTGPVTPTSGALRGAGDLRFALVEGDGRRGLERGAEATVAAPAADLLQGRLIAHPLGGGQLHGAPRRRPGRR